jgi:hypothetical protein
MVNQISGFEILCTIWIGFGVGTFFPIIYFLTNESGKEFIHVWIGLGLLFGLILFLIEIWKYCHMDKIEADDL